MSTEEDKDPRDGLNAVPMMVFDFFYGRKGFNWWWDGIERETQLEIITELNALFSPLELKNGST